MPFPKFLKNLLGVLTVITVLIGVNTTAIAATIELEQAVHFVAASGDPVVVAPGTYTVELAETWIRLHPNDPREAVLLEATTGIYEEHLSEVAARSLSVDLDVHRI